jgi:nucleoporin POM152
VKRSQSPQKAITDTHPPLQKTQRLRWVKLTRPGTLSLEAILDGKTDVRLRQVNTTVVHCPTARFEGPEELKIRCIGASEKMKMRVFGVPPLHLQWQRDLRGKIEEFSVERIDGSDGTQPVSRFVRPSS